MNNPHGHCQDILNLFYTFPNEMAFSRTFVARHYNSTVTTVSRYLDIMVERGMLVTSTKGAEHQFYIHPRLSKRNRNA